MILTHTYNTDTKRQQWQQNTILGVFCRVHTVAENTSVANNTWTNVPFTTITDTTNFNLTANVVKPLVPGTYAVFYGFYTSNQAIGIITARFNHSDRTEVVGVAGNNSEDDISGMSLFYFDGINDTISLQIRHANGSSRTIFVTGTDYYAYINLVKVGE